MAPSGPDTWLTPRRTGGSAAPEYASIEIEGLDSVLGDNGFDVGDMFDDFDVGSDDEPNGWDIFFGDDDEYGDDRDDY